ncbi:30S ribosome-binding factor RbfA [Caedibacter taeniospiralis]|jgi:ribosome-binding factor A|uniref:30S ribosome-binding factor RbfA n=1 Tax=Caedibacter taeniospiralis TaxID=28907 RepID=UPI0037C02035
MATSSRVERVGDEIQKIIVSLLSIKIRDPRLQWISITGVEVSKDLSYAKVFFSSLNTEINPEQMIKAFDAAKGFFRSALARELRLRVAPDLRFFYDDSLAYGNKMNSLIEKARNEDAQFIQNDESNTDDHQDNEDE